MAPATFARRPGSPDIIFQITAIEGPPPLAASFIPPDGSELFPRGQHRLLPGEQRRRSTLGMLHGNGRIDHPATGGLIVIELTDEELNTVTGAWDRGGQEYGARWAAARAAPTPAEWKAIGEQLSAIYIANHSPHLGRPLK
jgi:hypothetical protein